MNIVAKEKLLVLRFSIYKKYDFIYEHELIIQREGAVWLLKLGKKVTNRALEDIMNSSCGLILKAPKAYGGKLYYCRMLDAKNMTPTEDMLYPQYYNELVQDMFWFSLDGTWIKVDSFVELDENTVSKLRLVSNDKPLEEVFMQTRTTTLYAYSTEDIILGNR